MAARAQVSLVLGCLLTAASPADVRLPSIISDHMVLQQDGRARIWGWAEPGELVRVTWSFDDQAHETQADPDGEWEVWLQMPGVSRPRGLGERGEGPHTITVRARNEILVEDVLIGEVWLASGQSNMQMSIDPTYYGVENWEEELAEADYPKMRFFEVQRAVSASPLEDCDGEWTIVSPETVGPFSAVAYSFGQLIHVSQDMPVGLIGSTWGGTVIEAWTSAEGLRDFPEFRADLNLAARLARDPDFGAEQHQRELEAWSERSGSVDPGSRADGYAQKDFDDSQWQEVELPGVWEDDPRFEGFDGFVWYRREFRALTGGRRQSCRLTLGPIDDMDSVWVNGQLVGRTEEPGHHQQPREYTVPPGVIEGGANVIAIRVLDTGGAGGLYGAPGQMAIATTDGGRSDSVDLSGTWKATRGAPLREIPPVPRRAQLHQNSPTALSNAMIEPLTPYTIRGAIWYQGESNRTRARQYRALLPALIADWRRRWGIELPFYYVQIAPFAYGGDTGEAAALREAQMMAMDAVENVGMAVTMDLGDPRDIHPKEKKLVGLRLGLWALEFVYGGVGKEHSGPVVERVDFAEDAARITLAHADGLQIRSDKPAALFELAGADGAYVPADSVEVEGIRIVVRARGVGEVRSVRYAWGAADEGVLYNSAGLPASSFRWPIP